MQYLLFYDVAEDYVARRAPFREEHLRKGWEASQRGELILGGAFANPTDGAMLLFQGDSPEVAERFARADPYVTSGAVKRWYVREWTTVVGPDAATPIQPTTQKAKAAGPAPRVSAVAGDESPAMKAGMIFRMWRGRGEQPKADRYIEHAKQNVFPALSRFEGYRGAYLLRRVLDATVEFVVVTLWDSMSAVRNFAGPHPEKAVVEPEAKAVLTDYDRVVSHFEIVHSTEK
jgi:heme-degrading monooxygenase HmoA/uncharacterized protein YciI